MPVVINEFEVIAESPPAAQAPGASAPSGSAAEPPAWTTHDIEQLVRRYEERMMRVRE
jgi:hypothetical protein